MTTFLIQTIDGKVVHDFAFHLIEGVRYQNWIQNQTAYEIIYDESVNHPNCIPIGSLEFVFHYIEAHYGIPSSRIVPINIPNELMEECYTKRKVQVLKKEDIIVNEPLFVKSAESYKSFTEVVEKKEDVPDGTFLVSEVVDITSEWRSFVFQNKLVGLQSYMGDFTAFPHVEDIQNMIRAYQNAPISYTLDVGVNERGTFVMEVHPFVSCGLYGFRNYQILPIMCVTGFKYMLEKAKEE